MKCICIFLKHSSNFIVNLLIPQTHNSFNISKILTLSQFAGQSHIATLKKITCLGMSRGSVAIEHAKACQITLFDSPMSVELVNTRTLLPLFHFEYIVNR